MKGINIAMSHTGRALPTGAAPTAEDVLAAGVVVDGHLVRPADVQLFRENTIRSTGDGCWMWTGTPGKGGYGRTSIGGWRVLAHRLAYAIATRLDPTGLVVRHRCNVRLCVNDEHLIIGTQADNVRDAVDGGRVARGDNHGLRRHPEARARGERHGGRALTATQVKTLREENPLPVRRGTYARLARGLGVKPGAVREVLLGLTWLPDSGTSPARRQRPRRQFEAEWTALKLSYGFACLRCGKKEPDIELCADHVIPTSKGGAHNIANIQPLCRSCNGSKGVETTDYRPAAMVVS